MEKPTQKIIVGVISSVVAGLILRTLTGINPLDVFPWIWGIISKCFRFASETIAIPRWFFGLLLVVSVTLVIRAFAKMRGAAAGPSEMDYREDQFEGLVWRWRYGTRGTILGTWCFCPSCDTVLVYGEDAEYDLNGGRRDVTHISCERCGVKKATLGGHRDQVVARIERQIERKLRVGEWREVVGRKPKP